MSNPPRLPETFNRLAWSNLAAQSAEQIALAAAPIVAVLTLGVAEGQTGLLQTALTLPFVLFAIPAGLLADRISRRSLMAGAEALRAAALATIVLLLALGALNLSLLALLGFAAVCGTVVYSVAAPALVPSLVNSDLLPAANARIELARTIAFACGPALGGVLVGWWGASPAFGFAAALSVIAVVLLSGIYEPARTPAPRRHPLQDIREGAAFVFHHPLLRPVFITQFIFNTGWFLQIAVFVPYAVRHLGLTAAGIGAVLTMYGVGMVIGALFATRVMKRIAFGTVVGLGPVTGFVAAVVMGADGAGPLALARGFELLPARRRADPVGDLDHDAAAVGDPAAPFGARLRHQHHELRRPPGRLGTRCDRRRPLERGSVPLSSGGGIRRAGAGHLALARGDAGSAAGHGGR
ncbi:putative MFS family arabinose efflux permease [Bradyrhizobium sp. LM4.3]